MVADKLNYYRYLSHFRSVHRGAFFAEMRTTSVRKLLPEAWGEIYTLDDIRQRCEDIGILSSSSQNYILRMSPA